MMVSTFKHELCKLVLDHTIRCTGCEKVYVFSDIDFYPGSIFFKIDRLKNREDYSRFILKELGKHVVGNHFMIVQYDGMPACSSRWNNEFLYYDYIGACFECGACMFNTGYHSDRCIKGHNVGNGGFSIRSRLLLDVCLNDDIVFDPQQPEDTRICICYHDLFTSLGVRYAPAKLARTFSTEILGLAVKNGALSWNYDLFDRRCNQYPTYGFHGTLGIPFFTSDEYLHTYISLLTKDEINVQVYDQFYGFTTSFPRIESGLLVGLYRASRYEHLEQYIDKILKYDIEPLWVNEVLDINLRKFIISRYGIL